MSDGVANQTILKLSDGEFFNRPRGCFFLKCDLEKAGNTEPFAIVRDSERLSSDSPNDQFYDFVINTNYTHDVDKFQLTCEIEGY